MNTEVSLPERQENRKLFDFYFKIRPFEADGKLYEKLGVTHAQTIIMSISGIVHKLLGVYRKVGNYFIEKPIDNSSLRKYVFATKFNETIHALVFPFCIPGLIKDVSGDSYGILFSDIVCLAINGYCVMLQRYNRARIENILIKRYKEET